MASTVEEDGSIRVAANVAGSINAVDVPCRRPGNAVSGREGRDRLHQQPHIGHALKKTKEEEQANDAEQDVIDTSVDLASPDKWCDARSANEARPQNFPRISLILRKHRCHHRKSGCGFALLIMIQSGSAFCGEEHHGADLMQNLSEIKSAFELAAYDGSKWQVAMETIAAATGSSTALLFPIENPAIDPHYADGWARCGLSDRDFSNLLRDRIISNAGSQVPEKDELNPRQKSPERESLPWFAGISVAAADVDRWCLLIQRSNEQGTFSEVELKRLAGLSAELSIVATEARRLGIVRAEGALRIFNMLHLPAALLDRYGRLVEMNQEAKHLFGDDVTICRRQIVSCNHDATMSLDRTLREFIASRGPSTIMPMVTLPRKEDRPLLATGIRLSAISPDVFARCQVVLIFFDLNAHPQPLDNVLRQSFGLSAAETRLAMGLATGKSISVLAEDLNISKQTARHELKSVFAKLSVHRQSELVALLSLLPRSTH